MSKALEWLAALEIRKEPLVWVCAGLTSLILFFYLTFPYHALQLRILGELSRGTGWDVRAAEWSRGVPLVVEWHDLIWSKPGRVSIPVDLMRLNVGMMGAIIGPRTLDGTVQLPGLGQVGGGRITGTVSAASWSFLGPVSIQGEAQQVDLALVGKPLVIKGLLNADVTQEWENRAKEGAAFKGDGSWKVEIKELELDRIPFGGGFVPALSFNRVIAIMNCRDSTCNIAEFRADGPDGTLTAQGRVLLQQPLESSRLELSLTVLPGAGWAQKSRNLPVPPLPPGIPFAFKLLGTVANPNLSL